MASRAHAESLTIKAGSIRLVPKFGPLFYGLMTEEINYSYDGGLYGELIQNRIFKKTRSLRPGPRPRQGGSSAAAGSTSSQRSPPPRPSTRPAG